MYLFSLKNIKTNENFAHFVFLLSKKVDDLNTIKRLIDNNNSGMIPGDTDIKPPKCMQIIKKVEKVNNPEKSAN